MALKPAENTGDLRGFPEIGHGIGDGVVIAQPQQRCKFLVREFIHACIHVVREHKLEEHLRLAVEARADLDFRFRRALLAR